jgi:hypothetical protein
MVMRGKPVTVELLFDQTTTAWVKDRTWHHSQRMEPKTGGRLRMTLTVAAATLVRTARAIQYVRRHDRFMVGEREAKVPQMFAAL